MKTGFGWQFLKWCVIILGIVLMVGPLYLVACNSLKTLQTASQNFFALPQRIYWGNYTDLFQNASFWVFLKNSTLITLVSIALVVLIVPMVAYSIARNFFRSYFKFLYYYLIVGLFVPFQIIMLPLVKQMTALHLTNQLGVIVIYVSTAVSQGIFLFVSYMQNLPIEMEEAAQIDGCSVLGTYFRIVLPVVKPMAATLVIIDCLWFWNDFQLPLLLLNKSPDFWTLPIFQYNFKSQYSFDYTKAFAAYLTCLSPIVVLYIFCQKYIISGLTAGAVKS